MPQPIAAGDAARGRHQHGFGKIVEGHGRKEHAAGCALKEMRQRASLFSQPEGDLHLALAALMHDGQGQIVGGKIRRSLRQHCSG